MATRDAREDWRRFDVGAIPSKQRTPHLDRFLAERETTVAGRAPLTLLDVGCGDGRVGKRLYERGFSVVGVDISASAVQTASEVVATADGPGHSLRFEEADFAADDPPRIAGSPFDLVVCRRGDQASMGRGCEATTRRADSEPLRDRKPSRGIRRPTRG